MVIMKMIQFLLKMFVHMCIGGGFTHCIVRGGWMDGEVGISGVGGFYRPGARKG